MWAYYLPIHSTSITTFYLVDIMQWQGGNIHTEISVKRIVRLMLGKPKRKHGYLVREVEKFNSKELVSNGCTNHQSSRASAPAYSFCGDAEYPFRAQAQLLISDNQEITTTTSWGHFEQAQLLISDNQEITTTTSWVENFILLMFLPSVYCNH